MHAVLGPVLVQEPAKAKGDKELPLRRVLATDLFAARAKEMESALRDAAQDLGLLIDVGVPLPSDGARDIELVKAAAAGQWILSPRLEPTGSDSFVLRIVAVPPKSPTMLVRVERVSGATLATRAVVMLRDFVSMHLGAEPAEPTAEDAAPRPDEESARSRGRAVLVASSTLFGLYTGFAIHKSSQSDDPRLLYPLLALGSGIGLGAALLASDEWNVTTGSAWTIAAGSWWGVVAGLNYASGRDVKPFDDRFAYGLAGGLVGTATAITWVSVAHFDDGDAALVHSGAAFGTLIGATIDLLVQGSLTAKSPATGAGIGAAAGFLGGGTLAAFVTTSAQRVLLVDLGAGLGALGGASIASPLVFKDPTTTQTRLFLAGVLGGTLIGGGIGLLATREHPTPPQKTSHYFPVVAPVADAGGRTVGWSAGLGGLF